jgi:hypothetical protein
MPQTIIDLLNQGIEILNADKYRRGNVIHLPAEGDLIITGDIHGHRRNFERIVSFTDLSNHPKRQIQKVVVYRITYYLTLFVINYHFLIRFI